MLSFIRSDLAELAAYSPHTGDINAKTLDRLDTNESPYDLPDSLKEKLAWLYQHQLETNRYPDGGHALLKAAIASYVNEFVAPPPGFASPEEDGRRPSAADTSFTPAHLSVGNGSDELIRSLLIATCVGGAGSALVATPTFSIYGILAKILGIPVLSVERRSTDFAIDLAAAQHLLEQTVHPPLRLVFVVHPNSPTANLLTPAEIDWLRSLPDDVLVVIDEAYFEFSQTSLVEALPQHPNWLILRTFSKAFRLAACRVGYAIAHPELITALEKVRLPYNLPSFSQAAALLTLDQRQLILPVVSQILAERDRLHQALSQHEHLQVWPSAANFIYLRLKDQPNAAKPLEQLTQDLKAQGTLVRHTGGGLRITVGTPEENDRTLERLQNALFSVVP